MYRLLLVDDEEVILRGLVELIEEHDLPELEVVYAFSAREALGLMHDLRVDIVMTDIEMPQMTGLQMHKEIIRQWPHCKVIFLTGYDEFSYAQEAIRHHSFDFLLKTESDDQIIQTIQRAVDQLDSQFELEHLIQSARAQMRTALPYLQKAFFSELLAGSPARMSGLQQRFAELQVPLVESLPLMVVLGKLELWQSKFHSHEQPLLQFAIQNIAEELLSPSSRVVLFASGKDELVWFIQPLEAEAVEDEQAERRLMSFVNGSLEAIQSTCQKLLKTEIALYTENQWGSWLEAPGMYIQAKQLASETARTNERSETEQHLIARIHTYIHDHLAQEVSLTSIAQEVSLNPSYLSRTYKQITGKSLSEEIASIRLRKSIALLKQPHYRMHEISAAVGFVSDNYFYRFFKKYMNVTPQEFRERESE